MGWLEREREGIAGRRAPDLVMSLALVHHLVLGRNIPMSQVVDWLTSLAPQGIVEFVPKEDPMASQLLALKPDVDPDYTVEAFEIALGARARVVRRERVTASGRVLFGFAR